MRILKFVAAMVLVGASAFAQETTEEAPAEGAEPALADQFPVGGVQEQPQEVVRATHGDWEIRCAGETDNCFMYQLLLDANANPVAEFSLIKLPIGSEAVAGATVVAPLGTMLTRGLTMRIDEGEATTYPFSWCTRPGCFARFGLTDLLVNGMQSGTDLKLVVFSIAQAQAPIEVTASLSGFTAAFEELPNQAN